jgi:protoheme IX farnesyltransferase
VGSIAGAIPPVVGYTAASRHLDTGAWLLFFLVAAWQLPHFFAIAIYRLNDYAAASIPVLPRVKGIAITKRHMLLYVGLFSVIGSLFPLLGYTGYAFFFIFAPLCLGWAYLCITGFTCADDTRWAKKMFFFSLAVILGTCSAIALHL